MADLEHATENDTDLIGDHDARHWAERFAHRFPAILQDGEGVINDVEGLMLTWFAGAIETGKMARTEE